MKIVYLITCLPTGQQYVGLTSQSFDARWAQHRYDAKSGRADKPLSRAIREHGDLNFSFQILARGKDATPARERSEIDSRSTLSPHGLNAETGGMKGKKQSEETRRRMSESARARSSEERKRAATKRHDFIHGKDAIRARFANGETVAEIARDLGLKRGSVWAVVHR